MDGWVTLRTAAVSAALFDPMNGKAGVAAVRQNPPTREGSAVYLQLEPGASMIVRLSDQPTQADRWSYWQNGAKATSLEGEWNVVFKQGGPALPSSRKLTSLSSWTDFGGDAGAKFSGTAVYSLPFARPTGNSDAWRLDLGQIGDSGRIRLNGKEVAGLIQPPWTVVIPAAELKAENRLEVIVTNLAANRIADMDRRGVKWKKFYNTNMPARLRENMGPDKLFTAAHWSPRPSGLLGPVTLTPVQRFDPEKR